MRVVPEVAAQVDSSGDLPIHVAILRSAAKEVMLSLVELSPLSLQGSSGGFPLHLALSNQGTPTEVVLKLVELAPEVAKERDAGGDLPIHWAVKNMARVALRKLMELCPETLFEQDSEGDSPVHLAIKQRQSLIAGGKAGMRVIVTEDVQSDDLRLGQTGTIRTMSDEGDALIEFQGSHQSRWVSKAAVGKLAACTTSRWDAATIVDMLERLPAAAEQADAKGDLPIHAAIRHGAAREVVLKLLEFGAVGSPGSSGDFPLHLALKAPEIDAEVVTKLLELAPEVARQQEANGDLPIHLAIQRGAPRPVVLKLTEFGYLASRGSSGHSPLHLALTKGMDTALVLKLVELAPDVTQQMDAKGDLPIHTAIQRSAAKEVLLKLAELGPWAVRGSSGDFPLHLANTQGAATEVVVKLVELAPQVAAEKDSKGLLPVLSWLSRTPRRRTLTY